MGKETKTFGITRAHLEEDAGTSIELVSLHRFVLQLTWGVFERFTSQCHAHVD